MTTRRNFLKQLFVTGAALIAPKILGRRSDTSGKRALGNITNEEEYEVYADGWFVPYEESDYFRLYEQSGDRIGTYNGAHTAYAGEVVDIDIDTELMHRMAVSANEHMDSVIREAATAAEKYPDAIIICDLGDATDGD